MGEAQFLAKESPDGQSSATYTIPAEQFEGIEPYGLQPEPDFTTGNQLALYHSGGATASSGADICVTPDPLPPRE